MSNPKRPFFDFGCGSSAAAAADVTQLFPHTGALVGGPRRNKEDVAFAGAHSSGVFVDEALHWVQPFKRAQGYCRALL
jgi:hypothetical protein